MTERPVTAGGPGRAPTTRRRPPALASRLVVAAGAVAGTVALVGWMARSARAAEDPADPAPAVTIRRYVVVEPQPAPEPYIVLEAAPAGRTVTVVTQPARVVRRAPAAATTQAPAPISTSSGS